jgi:uncharacterized membrane protein
MKRFIKAQGTIILFGLGFWLPVGILIFVITLLFSNVEHLGRDFLLLFIPEERVYSGLGVAFGIIVIYLSGVLLKLTSVRNLFSKIPLLGIFFGAGEMLTIDRLLHLQPCLFQLSPTCLSYGWILSEEKVRIGSEHASFGLINVYYPNVPTLVTGQVYPVRKETVIRLGNPSKEVIDLLLYTLRSPQDLRYLPWEGESQEDFVIRATCCGLKMDNDLISKG